ncbi:MAG: hypothetical protein IJA55_01240 [Clostridia bacterium]|nr:hypothetical protein [Clostridia bacterium]
MIKKFTAVTLALLATFLLTGCSSIGNKSTSMSIIYGATAFLSLLLLAGYCLLVRKKEGWFYLLFSSVLVVNVGYLMLSVSKTLELALHANRLAYLGSVFLPLAMLMIIINVCKFKQPKFVIWLLLCVSIFVFLVAASPGYLDIYYKSVSLETVNGVSVLVKEYGPWHIIYLFYLLVYFIMMISAIIHATLKKKIQSVSHGVILLVSVFVNIGIWLLEQLVKIDFEFLSVSYIVSELFLIGLYLMLQEIDKYHQAPVSESAAPEEIEQAEAVTNEFNEKCRYFAEQLSSLTPTETNVYRLYVEGKGTKEVLEILNIKENTLKYHNKNIYSKLGVSSRKQLIEIARILNNKKSD